MKNNFYYSFNLKTCKYVQIGDEIYENEVAEHYPYKLIYKRKPAEYKLDMSKGYTTQKKMTQPWEDVEKYSALPPYNATFTNLMYTILYRKANEVHFFADFDQLSKKVFTDNL